MYVWGQPKKLTYMLFEQTKNRNNACNGTFEKQLSELYLLCNCFDEEVTYLFRFQSLEHVKSLACSPNPTHSAP